MPDFETELCCPICRVKVSQVTDPDGRIWYGHPGSSDHEVGTPLRLPSADVIHVCDFCLRPGPVWMFPLRDHANSLTAVNPEIGFRVQGVDTDAWWGACQECADLITARSIGALRDRALAVLELTARRRHYREPTEWERATVITQLAAFWLAVPGEP
jgi:hypothetical protein